MTRFALLFAAAAIGALSLTAPTPAEANYNCRTIETVGKALNAQFHRAMHNHIAGDVLP